VHFATISPVKAGWLLKERGRWILTPEGRTAYERIHDPKALMLEAVRLYQEWRRATDIETVEVEDKEADFAMTTEAVAQAYVNLCRQQRFFEPAMQRLWSPDIVRVAPLEAGGDYVEVKGPEAIEENSQQLSADEEIHGLEVEGPFVGTHGRFAVRFAIDTTFHEFGTRMTVTKLCLYTVERGQITREEVFYLNGPRPG